MDLSKQVCSSYFAKRLKELGVKQESLFYWDENGSYLWRDEELKDSKGRFHIDNCISAFTVAELGEMLPPGVRFHKHKVIGWISQGQFENKNTPSFQGKNEAESRARLLCDLIEKGIVNPNV